METCRVSAALYLSFTRQTWELVDVTQDAFLCDEATSLPIVWRAHCTAVRHYQAFMHEIHPCSDRQLRRHRFLFWFIFLDLSHLSLLPTLLSLPRKEITDALLAR